MSEQHTILLVDDSENDLLLMGAAFRMAKWNIARREVRDGEQAIAYLKGDGPFGDRNQYPLPTIMLLDLNVPKIHGFDVLAWVRAQPGLKRLAIIIMTASLRIEDVTRAFDLGATSFLVKPSSLDELVTMLRSLSDWVQINRFPPLHDANGK